MFRLLLRSAVAALAITPVAGTMTTAESQVANACTPVPVTPAPVPYAVGEELVYRASFGGISAGTARMRVEGVERVRGRPAYHVSLTIKGGVPFFRVRDRYDSWIDVETLASLRHRQEIAEGRYRRTTAYEIYPERVQYQKDGDSLTASVRNPLDDGSFIYAVRAAGVGVGETRRDDRYFRPDRNPVVLSGVRRDTVTVGAGTFASVLVRPTIRTKGLFAEGGEAQVWFSDDAARVPVLLRTRFSKFSLVLALESVARGAAPAPPALTVAAAAACTEVAAGS